MNKRALTLIKRYAAHIARQNADVYVPLEAAKAWWKTLPHDMRGRLRKAMDREMAQAKQRKETNG